MSLREVNPSRSDNRANKILKQIAIKKKKKKKRTKQANPHSVTVSSPRVAQLAPRQAGLLSWAFSRFQTDQNSAGGGSLLLRLCFQDVTQAPLNLDARRYNNLPCACFVSSAQLFCFRLSSHSNSGPSLEIGDVKSKMRERLTCDYTSFNSSDGFCDGVEGEMRVVRNFEQWKYVGQVTAPLRKLNHYVMQL